MKHLRSFKEMAVVAIHEGKKMRSKLDNRGKTCMFVGYADDHSGDVYRFVNIKTKGIIMSRDARWLNIICKHYKKKHNYARRQVELFLDEEESLSLEGYEPVENRIEGDVNNTPTQRKLGLDIGIIGAKEETLEERLSLTPGTPRFTGRRLENPEDKVSPEEYETYRSGAGLYLTKHSRPDICNPVRELSKTMDAPAPVRLKESTN